MVHLRALEVIDGAVFVMGDIRGCGRWAHQGIPAWVIFDLGELSKISETRFSFYNFAEEGYISIMLKYRVIWRIGQQ